MALFGRKRAGAVDPMDAAEAWQVLEGEYDGRPLLARFNTGLSESAGHPEFSIQIGVAIPFVAPGVDGLPSAVESEELHRIEERIDEAIRGRAVFAGVITTAGMREFILYTGSADWIEDFHREMQAAIDTHEVQVMAQGDPEWTVFRRFVQ